MGKLLSAQVLPVGQHQYMLWCPRCHRVHLAFCTSAVDLANPTLGNQQDGACVYIVTAGMIDFGDGNIPLPPMYKRA